MGNFDYKKYLVENKLTANSNLNEEATDKFYVSFKYSSGMGGTFKNLP